MLQGEMTLPPDLLARTQTALQGRDVVWGHREVLNLGGKPEPPGSGPPKQNKGQRDFSHVG